MKTLNKMLDAAAAEAGRRTAYVTADRKITFGELHAAVLNTATGLRAAGVGPQACVAIIHRNAPEFVIAYFGLNRLRAIAVPINFMVQKADELAYMLNDCKAVGVVTQREFLPGLRQAAAKVPTLKRLWVTDAESPDGGGIEEAFSRLSLTPAEGPFAGDHSPEDETVAILYTSGTTGNPKGVMLTHKNLVTNTLGTIEHMGLNNSDVGLCILPMFHSFAWTGNVLLSIALKTKLIVWPAIAPAKPWLQMMGSHGVSLFAAVPQVYAVLAKEAQGLKGLILKWWFFRRVRMCLSGAAPLSPTVADAFENAFGVPILEGYGLTETSPVATVNALEARRRASVGKPIRDVRVKIVDDAEKPLGPDQEGEICISGPNIMKGYFNLPEATRDSFTRDGWFKSGDIGVIDRDGFVFIRDRKKDMIIIKGLKVFSAQVEAKILEHPAIAEAAVIGIPDETGDESIKAFLVLHKGAAVDKPEITKFFREKLDNYKRPRDFEILEALPKNALQKVLKRELRKIELEKRAVAPKS